MKNTSKMFALLLTALLIGNTLMSCDSNTKKETTDMETSTEANAPNEEKVGTIHLTNETFKQKVFNYEVEKEWKYLGTKPCIIDFYASWCGPCKMIAPILEDLAVEYKDDIVIYKINTEEQRELAGAFGIQSIPALLFVPVNGQPQMVNGALPKESFVKAINDVLLKK